MISSCVVCASAEAEDEFTAAAKAEGNVAAESKESRCMWCDCVLDDTLLWDGDAGPHYDPCCGRGMCRSCTSQLGQDQGAVVKEIANVPGNTNSVELRGCACSDCCAAARAEEERDGTAAEQREKLAALRDKRDRLMRCPACEAPNPDGSETWVAAARALIDRPGITAATRAWAQTEVGCAYRDGDGVESDIEGAAAHFEAAMLTDGGENMSIRGGARAAFYLAELMLTEWSNREEAKRLLTLASDAGFVSASTELGRLVRNTKASSCSRESFDLALACFRRAAEAGDSIAAYHLGDIHDTAATAFMLEEEKHNDEGGGCAIGPMSDATRMAEAKEWFGKAAREGDRNAMYRLARVLEVTDGCEADPAVMSLVREAAKRGNAKAKAFLPELRKDLGSTCDHCGKVRVKTEDESAPGECEVWMWCRKCRAVAYCSAACKAAASAEHGPHCAARHAYRVLDHKKRPTLRFKHGMRVECWAIGHDDEDDDEVRWCPGEIRRLWYNNRFSDSDAWAREQWIDRHGKRDVAYQVRLDTGRFVYTDDDSKIKRQEVCGVCLA